MSNSLRPPGRSANLVLTAKGYRGRKPSFTRDQLRTVQDMLGREVNIVQIAKVTNLSRQTVHHIKDNPVAAESTLASWGAYHQGCEGAPLPRLTDAAVSLGRGGMIGANFLTTTSTTKKAARDKRPARPGPG
jgi:hypothetical protein